MPKTISIIFLLYGSFIFSQDYGAWRDTDSLNTERSGHAMVVLQNGNILVSGNDDIDTAASNRSCEIFDVSTEVWRKTASLNKPKGLHKMVILNNGEVLAFSSIFNKSCEIFNPDTEEWRFTDSMLVARDYGNSGLYVKLDNGKVLIIGGNAWNANKREPKILKSCEIFDPIKEKWEFADSLLIATTDHSAIKLNSGNVLVVGSKYCQLYNAEEDKWEMTDSLDERGGGNAMILLDNSNVLLVGGGCSISPCGIPIDKRCAIYNTETNKWEYVGEILRYRRGHSVFKISEKYIIIIGGDIFNEDTWEIFDIKEYNTVRAAHFNKLLTIDATNTIQMRNGNIMAVGGWIWDESYGLPIVYRSKECLIFDIATSVKDVNNGTFKYDLYQNYPNPFNPVTNISYTLPQDGFVQLKVYDILGREITTLINKEQKIGNFNVKFNAKDLSSGVYYYRIKAGSFIETKKMMLLR